MAPDAITLIKNDHQIMRALLDQLKDPASDRANLVEEIAVRLTAHARAEEEHVYPALVTAEPGESSDVHHGVEEHHDAEELLEELRETDPGTPDFEIALGEFVEAVEQHMDEEESEILPQLAESVDRSRLVELGRAFEQARLRELREVGRHPDPAAEPDRDEVFDRTQDAELPGGRSTTRRDELV